MSPIAGGEPCCLKKKKKRILKKSYLNLLENQICLLNSPDNFLSKNVRMNMILKDCSYF